MLGEKLYASDSVVGVAENSTQFLGWNGIQQFCLSWKELEEILPSEEQPYRKDSRKSLNREWPNVMSQRLNELFDCVVKARGGAVKKPNSRKKSSPWFRGHLVCIEPTCGRYYTVVIRNPPLSQQIVPVEVITRGELDHSARKQGFPVRRQIRGKCREKILADKSAIAAERVAKRSVETSVKLAQKRISLMQQLCTIGLPQKKCCKLAVDHEGTVGSSFEPQCSSHVGNFEFSGHPFEPQAYCADQAMLPESEGSGLLSGKESFSESYNSDNSEHTSTFERVVDIPLGPTSRRSAPRLIRASGSTEDSFTNDESSLSWNRPDPGSQRAELESELLRQKYYKLKIYKILMEIREKEPNFRYESLHPEFPFDQTSPLHLLAPPKVIRTTTVPGSSFVVKVIRSNGSSDFPVSAT